MATPAVPPAEAPQNSAGAQHGGAPYIGSRISLISKSEIRYEGILYTIDTKDSNIALQNGMSCFLSHVSLVYFVLLLVSASPLPDLRAVTLVLCSAFTWY